jgi:phospholipid/cholesterol/gamma-HCH transport system substrate-binding protein
MSRFSLTHRLALLGLALLLMTGAGIATILEGFGGRFATYDVVYADIPASGTGIATGSVVLFRDITVGTVATLGRELPHGLLRVTLHLDPSDLQAIPSGVRADVEIATVFGTQGINLVPPARRTGSSHPLAVGQTLPSVARSKTTTLQGDATDLDNLLNALHPAALDATLSAIATALRDQGPSLGSTIGRVAAYLAEMVPQLPGVESDITALGPVSHDLATAAAPLLSTLANGSVTAATINTQATQLRHLLAGAAPVADELTTFVGRTQAAYEDLVANSAPLLADVAANPDEIAQTLSGFDSWSKAFAAAESQGPYLSFSGDIEVSGSVQVVAAALGLPGSSALVEQGLGPQFFNPPTYTAADCPRYAGQSGPNCPPGPTAQTAPATAASGPFLTTPAEQAAAVTIATRLHQGRTPPSAALVTLLLEPLLTSLAQKS